MKTIPTIEQVMTPSPITVAAQEPLANAQAIMAQRGVRHLPVLDSGRVVSMISDRDAHVAIAAHKGLRASEELSVGDVSTLQTYMVPPETALDLVVEHMARNQIGSAIIAREGELLGIFTATDACRVLADCLRQG